MLKVHSEFVDCGNHQQTKCAVCFDFHAITEGFCCPQECGTFTCWDCLLQSYDMASMPGAIQGSGNVEGELLCSNNACKCPINIVNLAKSDASEAVLKAQEVFKMQVITSKKVSAALSQQEKQIRSEYARIEQIRDADEKVAVKLRLKIVEEVLTLRCPRCSTVFLDFDGCFALKCMKSDCGCGFCAWCLKDCGKDAHAHVKACPENIGEDYFNTEQAFKDHHRSKRIAVLRKLLKSADLNRNASEKLRKLMKRDLEDLGIHLSDVFSHNPERIMQSYWHDRRLDELDNDDVLDQLVYRYQQQRAQSEREWVQRHRERQHQLQQRHLMEQQQYQQPHYHINQRQRQQQYLQRDFQQYLQHNHEQNRLLPLNPRNHFAPALPQQPAFLNHVPRDQQRLYQQPPPRWSPFTLVLVPLQAPPQIHHHRGLQHPDMDKYLAPYPAGPQYFNW